MNFKNCPLPSNSQVWLYCRDSGGAEQDVTGQIEFGRKYCEYYQLTIAREFVDKAITGKSIKGREDFQEMIELAENSQSPLVDGILFWDIKRFARDQLDSQYYKAFLRRKGYILISLTDDIPANKFGTLIETFYELKAQQDLEDISKDVKRELRAIIEMTDAEGNYLGLWPRRRPNFFLIEPYDTGRRRNDGSSRIIGRLIPDPAKIPLVRQAFELRLKGMRYADIERELKLFEKNLYNVYRDYGRMFRNPIYMGELHYGDRIYKNFVPAMVPRSLWLAVQETLYKRPRRGASWPEGIKHAKDGTARQHLLSGLCTCVYCNGKIYSSTNVRRYKDRQYIYYGYCCTKKYRSLWKSCQAKWTPTHKIDKAVMSHVLDVFLTPNTMFQLMEVINELLNRNDLEQDIDTILQKIAELSRRRDNLVQLASMNITEVALRDLREVEKQIKLEQNKLKELEMMIESGPRMTIDKSVIEYFLADMTQILIGDDLQPKRVLLRQLLEQIAIGRDFGKLRYTFPFVSNYSGLTALLPINQYTEYSIVF